MPTIFVTDDDSPYSVELAGVGVIGGAGAGGIPVERAATVMPELQDDDGEPLTGAKLKSAAEAFAESHNLKTKSVKDLDEEALRVSGGAFPAGQTIREIVSAHDAIDQAYWEADEGPHLKADMPVQETAVHPQRELPDKGN